jgi:Ca-activated chloride channel family protein
VNNRWPLFAITLVWLAGVAALIATASATSDVVVSHWANGHMTDSAELLPAFAKAFNQSHQTTSDGKNIRIEVFKANSGEIAGELKSRIVSNTAIDHRKPDPTIVTPAADHWLNEVNPAIGTQVLDRGTSKAIATTYIGIVTSREMAQCLGWPGKEIGFVDVVNLATDSQGWSAYACAKPEWGREALIAFTYPSRSSTARSVLYTLYTIIAGKQAEDLTVADVSRPEVAQYVKRFQGAIDCYVPDTLDLNVKILTSPPCAQFFFIAEDNLVKLYQGKVDVPDQAGVAKHLERDLVMIYPREGSIIHNHTDFVVNAAYVDADEAEAAQKWTAFLRQNAQQQVFMQLGFRPTSGGACVSPLGSPFSQCTVTPKNLIYPDLIDPEVAAAILRAWD